MCREKQRKKRQKNRVKNEKYMGPAHSGPHLRNKLGSTVVSTQNLEFINMDVSGGYDQSNFSTTNLIFQPLIKLKCSQPNIKVASTNLVY